MSGATLKQAGRGRWKLSGVLDFNSVPAIWPALEKLVSAGGRMTLSLAGIRQTNSAGLVLLVEARDVAQRTHCHLHLTDLPAELLDLARMSRCEGLLANEA
ncbi:MAG: STAS domain-containing protein [Chromatiaceae bacterium]|nr:STAS domain-containing protein [Gammaproteobacteria bacterium]MCP5305213.1 STAS domain-containing protein [Chromatiaceae bacterium]MCP5315172.1 STAS domain-containing protein [Chromatiaceae bacterium]